MVNLLVDITNMFYRAMFSTSNYGKESSYTYDSEFECDQLMRKICTDLSLVIRQTKPTRVMLCKDSRPWRKDIEIIENEGYKGHRKKSAIINWDNIYKTQAEFFKIMTKKGFIVCDIDGAESDDIIAMWAEELFDNKNESCIILSGDEDVRQLIKSKDVCGEHIFICALNPIKQGGKNPTKKIYHDGNLVRWANSESTVSTFDLMFSSNIDTYKENIKVLVNDTQFEKIVVNGDLIALNKYFMGDDGDNIPAFYTWMKTTKAGKETKDRITPKKYEKIVEALNLTKISDIDLGKVRELKSIIEGFSKSEMDVNILSRMERQQKLVELKSSNFPEHIVDFFKVNTEKWLNTKQSLVLQTVTMQDMLKDSRYISTEYSALNVEPTTNASIFNDIEKLKNINKRNSLFS